MVGGVALKVGGCALQESREVNHAVAFVVVLYLTEQGIASVVQGSTNSACAVVVVKHWLG